MSLTTAGLDDKLRAFLHAASAKREDDVLARLRAETAPLEMARMQISVEQGRLMALLAQSIGARRALEIGTFTGYSALCVARVLPEDGTLVACDVSEEWTAIARRAWTEAGVADRIDLRLAPADETLDAMRAAGEDGTYDFAFIDADKEAYDGYYERCLALLRPGGLLTIDNVFLGGRIVDLDTEDRAADVVRALSTKIADDARVDPALVPIGDGLWVVRKR
jgi:caffeoyl-CoA O-methyltransferase